MSSTATWAERGFPWIPSDLEFQARMHAESLQRWMPADQALEKARAIVAKGECWWFYEPEPVPADGVQLRLFH